MIVWRGTPSLTASASIFFEPLGSRFAGYFFPKLLEPAIREGKRDFARPFPFWFLIYGFWLLASGF